MRELPAPLGKQKAAGKLNAVTMQRYDRAVQMIPRQKKELPRDLGRSLARAL
jgi:hypothetical protein